MATTTPEYFNGFGKGHLPGLIGVETLRITPEAVASRMAVRKEVMAPNGYLHAASVIALADTSCGYGCISLLPAGASGFTTIELKANFLGTARAGAILCRATPVHLGATRRSGMAVARSKQAAARSSWFAGPRRGLCRRRQRKRRMVESHGLTRVLFRLLLLPL